MKCWKDIRTSAAKALAMVREWIGIHKADLPHMWETQEFKSLSPLE
ncbi:MAG: hypothetical protein SOR75_00020 [Synergistes jonesii]|nr:hypothetical protein [Synergistes jonesii]MDY2983700.1 hypothetical protein [Synergistes jonesii]